MAWQLFEIGTLLHSLHAFRVRADGAFRFLLLIFPGKYLYTKSSDRTGRWERDGLIISFFTEAAVLFTKPEVEGIEEISMMLGFIQSSSALDTSMEGP